MNKVTKRRLVDYLKKIYNSSPMIVIKTYALVFSAWSKIRSLWLPVHLYTGIAHEGGNSLNFSYLGWDNKVLSYWLVRIFDQYEQVPCKKLIPVWKFNKYLKDKTLKCDLAMVELTNKLAKQRAGELAGFVLPRWLKMHLDVDLSLSLIKKGNDIPRRIRKYSLGVEKGYSDQDFAFFYEKMHKPYIECRHKESGIVEDYKKMLQDFKREKSTIYFVIKDGLRIAGLYEQNFDGIPFMHAVGILDGSDDIMKMGVIGALYYFALTDHRKNNIKRVNIGGTSPLLKDGLTMFKLSLGAKVSEIQHQDSLRLKLLPLRNSPAVEDFLTSNSFTYIDNEYVYCAIFKDETKEESEIKIQKLHYQTNAMNVRKARVFYFDTHNKLSECIPGT
ncbi:MAG: hypothetical protein KAR19_16555 [Bacteroidales bacterium]|nr:hypothetical protein [Bacteroidales bacterium]